MADSDNCNGNNTKKEYDEKTTISSDFKSANRVSTDAWITLAILSSLALITMYGETMIIPAIPDLISDFQIAYNSSSWILTAYLISGAIATPIAGKLSDIYGKKKILVIILGTYIFGTLIGGISSNFIMLVAARIIQGIGMSMFPIAFGIIRDKFPESKLAIGQGIFSSIFAGGAVIGLAVGGTIIEAFSWHATFFSIIPVSLVLTFIIIRIIPTNQTKINKSKDNKVDILGALLLTITIATFLISITLLGNSNIGKNSEDESVSILIVFLSIISVISLIFLLITQTKKSNPFIDLEIIKDRILLPTNVLLLAVGISIFMLYQTIPILVRSPPPYGFGGTAIDAANIQLPFMIISLIVSIISGFLISKLGNVKPTIYGGIISTIGFFGLLVYHSSLLSIGFNLAVIAVGLSLIEVGAFNITLVHTNSKKMGISMGITVLLFLIGMSIGPAFSGLIMETLKSNQFNPAFGMTYPSSMAYQLIFLTLWILSLIFIVLGIFARKNIKLVSK
ncbi:MAG: MFS transporter [Nitrososphaeraceae archaeon]|nr:MFS transporter [Nitrososphaeraceae archaeon]